MAIVLSIPFASAAEVLQPRTSVGEFSAILTLQRIRLQADHCSFRLPRLKPKFDVLMGDLSGRVQDISRSLLSSDEFRGVKDKPVPAEVEFAFEDSLDDARRNFERQDADAICQKTLQNLAALDDQSLRADLMQTLVAVGKMTRNLENLPVR